MMYACKKKLPLYVVINMKITCTKKEFNELNLANPKNMVAIK